MAEIAGIFLSPFLQVFFEKMASPEFVDFFRGRKVDDGLLMKLRIKLLPVDAVAEDAEDKQFTNTDVKKWLDELKDAVYDAEDVLDEIATKALQRKLDTELGTFGSKVRNHISTSRFVKKVEKRIKKLLDKLDFLVEEKVKLGLREGVGVGGNTSERLPTTSLIEESDICGRKYDKEAIINSLLSNDASDNEVGVVAIVGMGGIGKTTLAQLAYNDNKVIEHFNLKVWVCVSDPFDVFVIIKTILEEIILSHGNVEVPNQLLKELNAIKNLNQLQIKLKDALIGKKFLLVLDDVWEKSYPKWEALNNSFKSGVPGSKVIVTTRDYEVARVMRAKAMHRTMELPKEDCWKLFVKYAFHNSNSKAYPKLEAIGGKIVEKCSGLPLAIKAIGALLWSKLDVNEWNNVLRSEIWDSPINETGILPALKLSYKYLSPPLKRCFAYCSIFPKDHAFKKDNLVFSWMAEGLLPQLQNKTMEEVGDDYFLALVSSSLFQQSKHDKYVMHDLISDLTKFISREFSLCLENDSSCKFLSTTRHFTYFYSKFHIEEFATFHGAKRLRTILELNYDVQYAIYSDATQFSMPMLRSLRVLSLSHNQNIFELSNSIDEVAHLRYLDLSYTNIKKLPDSICKLCNLQTLNLSNCWLLVALPRDLYKLINLRHLGFAQTKVKEMPINMGALRCLQTLTKFIVGKHGRSGIGELGELTELRGSLPILELQNVESPKDAMCVNLREKYLTELVMEWRVDVNSSESQIESQIIVLDSLRPPTSLEILAINGYGGNSFPNWVGHTSFSNITSLRLEHCIHCCNLPPLGKLRSLQDLSIVGFQEVVTVGHEFYGSGSSSIKPFEALKVLKFRCMSKWEEWFSFDCENEGGAFPNLGELEIYECPKLQGSLPANIPSSVQRNIRDCPLLVA